MSFTDPVLCTYLRNTEQIRSVWSVNMALHHSIRHYPSSLLASYSLNSIKNSHNISPPTNWEQLWSLVGHHGHCNTSVRVKTVKTTNLQYTGMVSQIPKWLPALFNFIGRAQTGLEIGKIELHFPSGDDVWVKSMHNFVTVTEVLVARVIMLVVFAWLCWSPCWALTKSGTLCVTVLVWRKFKKV